MAPACSSHQSAVLPLRWRPGLHTDCLLYFSYGQNATLVVFFLRIGIVYMTIRSYIHAAALYLGSRINCLTCMYDCVVKGWFFGGLLPPLRNGRQLNQPCLPFVGIWRPNKAPQRPLLVRHSEIPGISDTSRTSESIFRYLNFNWFHTLLFRAPLVTRFIATKYH